MGLCRVSATVVKTCKPDPNRKGTVAREGDLMSSRGLPVLSGDAGLSLLTKVQVLKCATSNLPYAGNEALGLRQVIAILVAEFVRPIICSSDPTLAANNTKNAARFAGPAIQFGTTKA